MLSVPDGLIAPISTADLQRLSPTALAYLGDAVYELHVRLCYLMPPKRTQAYHQQVVAQVRAESQARHLRSLQPYLSPAEVEILKKGRNATLRCPKRVDLATYQAATSLETLLGYLYLNNPTRLTELLAQLTTLLLTDMAPPDPEQ